MCQGDAKWADCYHRPAHHCMESKNAWSLFECQQSWWRNWVVLKKTRCTCQLFSECSVGNSDQFNFNLPPRWHCFCLSARDGKQGWHIFTCLIHRNNGLNSNYAMNKTLEGTPPKTWQYQLCFLLYSVIISETLFHNKYLRSFFSFLPFLPFFLKSTECSINSLMLSRCH